MKDLSLRLKDLSLDLIPNVRYGEALLRLTIYGPTTFFVKGKGKVHSEGIEDFEISLSVLELSKIYMFLRLAEEEELEDFYIERDNKRLILYRDLEKQGIGFKAVDYEREKAGLLVIKFYRPLRFVLENHLRESLSVFKEIAYADQFFTYYLREGNLTLIKNETGENYTFFPSFVLKAKHALDFFYRTGYLPEGAKSNKIKFYDSYIEIDGTQYPLIVLKTIAYLYDIEIFRKTVPI